MPSSIDVARVQQYKDNVRILSQQRGSRLRGTVREDGIVRGKRVYFDLIGPTDDVELVTRHADTNYQEVDHTRRSSVMKDYTWAALVDEADQLKMIINPESPYAINAAFSMGRRQDKRIIAALEGTAETGEDGSGSQVLPSAQKIAEGGTGLTIAKLIEAKKKLDQAEVDPMYRRTIAVTASSLSDLLNTIEIKNSDYNTVKALVQGEIDTYLGFKFVRTELLTLTGTTRQVLAYSEMAAGLGIPQDINVRMTEMPNKNYSTQVFLKHSVGAVRIEDVQVVQIDCLEV